MASIAAVAATEHGAMQAGTQAAMPRPWSHAGCAMPALPGQQVTVVLADMHGGSMMGGRMMLRAMPSSLVAGQVSFIAYNHGSRTHELVVLPLASEASAGSRLIGIDGTVAETGSLGEASNNCGAGGGTGIRTAGASWVTVTLERGRYELLCNLPGHYAAGMYTQLDVT
jgi:hypothetical protein